MESPSFEHRNVKGLLKRPNLITDPVGSTLIRLTLPMTLGIVSMVGFNIVDTYFVGQLGKASLAALSFTFPVIMIVFSLAQGIGIGATALVSRSIGAGNHEKAARETTDALFLGLVIVGAASLLGFLTINPVFTLMGADDTTLPLVRQYMEVWYLTMTFVVIPFVGNSAIRSTGDTLTPSIIMVFAVFINAVLDPLLIFGFGSFQGWGIRGAAIATAISRMFTLVFSLYILGKRKKLLTRHFPGWSVLIGCWKAILYIGIPTAFSRMIVPIATSIVIALVAVYGEAAVAAWGVGSRLEMVSISLIWALAAVIAPFVGQNLGAEKISRIRRALKLASLFSMAWGAIMFALLNLFPETVASWFNDDSEVIQYTVWFLMIVPVGFGFQGIQLIVTSNLNTLGRPIPAFVLSAVHMLGLYVPLAYFGSQYRGFLGMMAGILIANIIGGTMQWIVNSYITRKICEDYEEREAAAALSLKTETVAN